MFYSLQLYLSFLLNSTNKYGVHSPFIYDLITNCFNKVTAVKHFKTLKKYKKELLRNYVKIEVQDFGAGSKKLNLYERKVSHIAGNAGISVKYAQLLTKLVTYFNCKDILEIGTSLGIGTLGLSLGNPNANITTLEGCSETLKIAKQKLKNYEITNIQFVEGNFSKTLSKTICNKTYDLIYFDGNHTEKATINYFEQCLDAKHKDSIFIFDDIYWSNGMTKAWQYIKKHPEVRLTIDTFQWGIVFFRKEQQEKEHFKIRI